MLHQSSKTSVVLEHLSNHLDILGKLIDDFNEAFDFIIGVSMALTVISGSVGHG